MSKICIVIPCYNEASRLNLKAFSDFIEAGKDDYDLLFVNDGSTDDTLGVLAKMTEKFPQNCAVHSLAQNSGKAEAVRQGLLKAFSQNKYPYIAYFDADLATPLQETYYMKAIAEGNEELLIILCSRIKRLGADIQRKVMRHYLGRVFSTFASVILKLPVYDTQCGAKLIKSDIIPQIFNEPFITSWLFDVEILARLRNIHPDTIMSILYEYPVNKWEDMAGSKLKIKHMIKVPIELLKVRKKYN